MKWKAQAVPEGLPWWPEKSRTYEASQLARCSGCQLSGRLANTLGTKLEPQQQSGLEQHPRKASDDSSREAQQKDKHNVCPDFSLATLSATGATTSAHFSSPHRGALWRNYCKILSFIRVCILLSGAGIWSPVNKCQYQTGLLSTRLPALYVFPPPPLFTSI